MTAFDELEKEAMLLPKDQRLKLAQDLIASVEEVSETSQEEAWNTEIADRIQRFHKDGQSVSAEEVFARLKVIAPGE